MSIQRKRVIGYLRVSTAEQVLGYGLDAQAKALKDYAKAQGLKVVAVLRDEGQSGSNGLDDRKGLAEALARIEAGDASALVVKSLDRLARDLLLQETVIARLRQVGADVLSATEPDMESEDPTRVMVRQMLGAIAQYERAVIRGRMMSGKAAKGARGGYTGGQPRYGTQAKDRQLAEFPEEKAIVETVLRLRAEGRSYREVCTALEAEGYRPRRAEHWQPAVVRKIALRAS